MIALIVAVSKNGVIGHKGKIPWNIPGEQSRFKRLTTDNIVIMGRYTYEEIGYPLPNRYTIVISKTKKFTAVNCTTAVNLKEAISIASHQTGDVFIAGGSRVYKEALPLCDRLYITQIDADVVGDRYFPFFDKSLYTFKVEKNINSTNNSSTNFSYAYVTYTKKGTLQ